MKPVGAHRFGYAVRELRSKQGHTQRHLAASARLRRTHLVEIEAGRVNPTLSTIEALAAALGLRASELLAEAERFHK